MAYVSVPKDLTKVKNKLVFNLTRAAADLLRPRGGDWPAVLLSDAGGAGHHHVRHRMVLLMLPAFLFAMYERDGLPLEKVLMNLITTKFLRPGVRKYEMTNLYEKKKAVSAKGTARKGARNVPKKKKR